ncbi:MAG: TolC family protein [Gammaproteobacteria bacterium]|nr:TolC family protein [Gammaproteobacteria bacterium]MDE1984386.1 TolC family protein [Gammaproteobacteria bacterium]
MSWLRTLGYLSVSALLSACLASAALAAAATGAGAAPQFAHPFTLVELTDMALSNNPQTKLAWAEIRSSQAGVELARAGYWPQISADYSITRSRTVNFSGASNSAQTRYSPSISLSYLLWDFGNRSGSLDAAKYALTAAELSNSQTLQDVILAVEQDYYQVLGLQALAQADAQSVKDAETSLDAAQQNQKSGLATVGDLYQTEAALAGAQLALQTAQGQLAVATGTLAVEVGLPANTGITLAPWDKTVTPVMPAQTIEELLAQARQARPELLASKASEQQAIAKLEATQGLGLPTLTLSANAGRTRTASAGFSQTANSYSAGLTLSIPLFAGFGDEAANKQAQALVDVSQASTAQLQQTVELEVWQAYQNLHTATVTLRTTEVQLKSAQQAEAVETARYHIGLDPILNLLTAQTTLASARVQQVQARLNWFTALAALGHAIGGLNAPSETATPESP